MHRSAAPAVWLRAIRRCGTNGVVIVVHIVAVVIHAAVIIDVSGIFSIVTGGTEPPADDYPFDNPIPYDTALRRISKSFAVAFYPRTE